MTSYRDMKISEILKSWKNLLCSKNKTGWNI